MPAGLAIAELGQAVTAQQPAELPQAAGLLGNFHRQHRFALLAQFRPFGHKAQPLEVHVGAAGHGHQGAATGPIRRICFEASHSESPGRFKDGAGVFKNVFDGGANGIAIDRHHPVHHLLSQAEGFLSHFPHSHAIGEQAHLLEPLALACRQ